jgi:ribosomal protein S12 methylthiotransferase accessory factor
VEEIELLDLDLKASSGARLVRELARRHGAPVADACRLPTDLFLLRSSWMPGLCFVGGKAGRRASGKSGSSPLTFSLSGAGEQLSDALASCAGEAVERLSQVERSDDVTATRPHDKRAPDLSPPLRDLVEEALRRNSVRRGTSIDWVRGVDLHDGSPTDVPADWCLRRGTPGPLLDPTAALSSGVAAGRSFEDAAVRAMLELIERDAAALWWNGGACGRPLACEGDGMAEATRLLQRLRAGSSERVSWVLDISSDLGIPVVVAISVDTEGSGFACGLGAASTQAAAVHRALLELGQMELGLQVAAIKQRSGESKLNEIERRHLTRAARLHAASCTLLHPRGVPRTHGDVRTDLGFDALKALLARHKMRAVLIDHTRPDMPIPVVQVICPGLQPLPSGRQTARLRKAIETAGGNAWSKEIRLL